MRRQSADPDSVGGKALLRKPGRGRGRALVQSWVGRCSIEALVLAFMLAACGPPGVKVPGATLVTTLPVGRIASPNWSPTGDSIALISADERSHGHVYVIDVASGEASQLTDWGENMEPQWAPDGSRIAYFDCAEVVLVDPAGSSVATPIQGCGGDWSADGNGLAVSRWIVNPARLEVVTLAGTTTQTVFESSRQAPVFGGVSWSSSSDRIAFSFGSVVSIVDDRDVYVVSPDGTGLAELTATPADEFDPSWSPDGLWLALIAEPRDTPVGTVMLAKADGTCSIAAFSAERLTGVDWSPTGESLAVTQANRLYTIDLAQLLGESPNNLDVLCQGTAGPTKSFPS